MGGYASAVRGTSGLRNNSEEYQSSFDETPRGLISSARRQAPVMLTPKDKAEMRNRINNRITPS